MSFKIFSLQLTGKIKSVATIEKQRKALAEDYNKFEETKDSEELKAFLELKELVNSEKFKQNKKAVETLHFKGSEEDNQLKEYNRLKKSARIRKYFTVANSNDLTKYEAEKNAQKMTDYYALLEYMKEGQFDKEKKAIQAQVFKGSVEEKHLKDLRRLVKSAAIRAYNELEGSEKLEKHKSVEEGEKFKRFQELKNASETDNEKRKEFKNLKKDAELRAYFRFEKSKKLKLYRETFGSHNLKHYNELKEFTSTEEFKKQEAFLKDKKKFEKSEAFKKQSEYKTLTSDATVQFVLKYEKSKLYKNYLDVKDSFDLKRYFELEELIESEEFKKRKAWLEDKKRWNKTDEFAKEQQYEQEKTKPEFVNYFRYKDTNDFDFFNNWEIVFEDDFKDRKLDKTKWGTCSPNAEKLLGENYAMPGDLNIFTNGNNLKIQDKLCIQVKNEKAKGKVWQMPAGFVPASFEYTSGMVTTEDKFEMEDGVLEAKVKFNPVKQVASSFYLTGDEVSPRVNLVEMGVKNNVGISTINSSGKIENTGLDISNLKRGDYIFTLEKVGANFTWKINNTEVWEQAENSVSKTLKLTASSLVINKFSGSSDFEIEWVKCYRKK